MKIIFNDATELQVQSVECRGDYLNIKTISAMPDQLRILFDDAVKTRKIIVEERGKQIPYEGYTEFYSTETYAAKIYGITMYRPEKTPEAKTEIVNAAVAVAQIQAQTLTDEQALDVKAIYPMWSGNGIAYTADYKVLYDGVLYKCIQEHTSQLDWAPEAALSLWTKVLISAPETIPEWEWPDSTNPYMLGDKVMHNGKTWESLTDNNVWEPGAIGTETLWEELE